MNTSTHDHRGDADAWSGFRRLFYFVAAVLAALLGLLWLLGYGPGGSACKVAAPVAAAVAPAVTAPAVTTPAVEVAKPAAAPVVEAPASAVAATVAAAATAVAAPVVAAVEGTTKATIYFALDSFRMPAHEGKTKQQREAMKGDSLPAVVAYLKANADAKANVSGFHDPSGNAAHNDALAHNRARTVRAALVAAGIAEDRMIMVKPQVTTGTGPAHEARRVEVTIAK